MCDVYDALISKRVYRPPWSHDAAMELLRRETGTAFDERCVSALEHVVTGETELALPLAAPAVLSAATE